MTEILNRFTKDNLLAAAMVNHINAKRLPGNRVSKAMHIASRLVNGYKDLSTLVAVEEDSGAELAIAEFVAKHRRPPSKAKVDGHTVPVEGIMAVLAVGLGLFIHSQITVSPSLTRVGSIAPCSTILPIGVSAEVIAF